MEKAQKVMVEFSVPVVVEIILERVTNVSMGTEIDNVVEFEDLAERGEQRPVEVAALVGAPEDGLRPLVGRECGSRDVGQDRAVGVDERHPRDADGRVLHVDRRRERRRGRPARSGTGSPGR